MAIKKYYDSDCNLGVLDSDPIVIEPPRKPMTRLSPSLARRITLQILSQLP